MMPDKHSLKHCHHNWFVVPEAEKNVIIQLSIQESESLQSIFQLRL